MTTTLRLRPSQQPVIVPSLTTHTRGAHMTRWMVVASLFVLTCTAVFVAQISTTTAQEPARGGAAAPGARGQAPAGRGAAPGRGAAAPAGRGAPLGVTRETLGDGPWIFDTAEQHELKLVSIARGLVNPWSLVFLPDGSMLVTERPGRLRIIRNGVLDPDAGQRRSGRGRAAAVRPDGNRAAPALRREPVSSTSPTASRARRTRW